MTEFRAPASAGQTRAALRDRWDHDHDMSLNRLAFCGLIGAYLWLVQPPELQRGLLVCAAYGAFAFGIVAALLVRPAASRVRRVVAMVGDISALAIEMQLGGASNAAFYPLFLWVIFGNGFRFGLAYLFLSLTLSMAGFGIVILTTPYWASQPLLSCGLLLSLLILPAYAGSLIRRLSAAKRIAEEASQAKSRFLATVSHELRTPLNAILGSTSLLRGTTLGPDQHELTDALEVGTRTLLSLIGGILDFSRIEAGHMTLQPVAFDLPDLLADVRELLGPEARLKGLRLHVHVSPRVPIMIVADRRTLHEVLLNLASNAIKFTSVGHVVLSFDATPLGPSRTRLRVEVADTGIGIEPEACERIFESFTQADDSIVGRFGGSGLGLSIARQLVTLMQGELRVDSVPGAGSAFRFELDCDVPAEAEIAAPLPELRVVLLCQDALLGARMRRELERLRVVSENADDDADALARLARLASAPVEAGRRPQSMLLVQRPGLVPGLAPDDVAADLLGTLFCVPVVVLIKPGEAVTWPAQMPDMSFRRLVGTWLPQDSDPARLHQALARVASRVGRHEAALPEPDSDTSTPRPQLHVLVADDNEINLRVVAKILERAGHTMRLVRNGLEALEALDQDRFDIVLMDVNMPLMSGIEATKQYRFEELGQDRMPIVALTADATVEAEQACRDAGMDACLTKPVDVFRLAATLERLARPAARQAVPLPRARPQPERAAPSRPAYDPQVLDNLRVLGGQAFLDDMLGAFAEDARQLVEAIGAAARAGDLGRFRNEVHALRSCAANVGATAIQHLCVLCREVRPAELCARGAELARELQAELGRLGTGPGPALPSSPLVPWRPVLHVEAGRAP